MAAFGRPDAARYPVPGGNDRWPPACRRIDAQMGIEALYRRSTTSRRHPRHLIYPYLLCESSWSIGQTKSGRRTSPTSRRLAALCTCRDHGLVQPQGAELAGLQQQDGGFLRRGARGGDRKVWSTGHLQHRPGIADRLQLHPTTWWQSPELASEITLPSTRGGARTRRLTAIHPTTFTSNLSPSRWLPNRWSCTYRDRENCLGKRDHLSRTGLIMAATIRNM